MIGSASDSSLGRVSSLLGVGVIAGVASGLFGVGGGVVVVPALMLVTGMDQRRAAGTSLVAIAPASVVGAVSYGVSGNVHLVSAALLAAGSIAGAQLGVALLRVLPIRILPWVFCGFVAAVIASLVLHVPSRGGVIHLGVGNGLLLVGVGVLAGVLSGLVGVGGGVVVVPALEVVFGIGDLLARGTSLAMMIPTAISGTITNLRRKNTDLAAGITVGIPAAALAPVGAGIAALLAPSTSTSLFIGFLVCVAVLVVWRSGRPATRRPSS